MILNSAKYRIHQSIESQVLQISGKYFSVKNCHYHSTVFDRVRQ